MHQLENSSNFSTKVLAIFVFLRIILFGHAKHEGCVATPQAESRGRGWFRRKETKSFSVSAQLPKEKNARRLCVCFTIDDVLKKQDLFPGKYLPSS